MQIPSTLSIYNYSINTFGIFVFIAFLLAAFGVWNEGRKDGFDDEKLFDMFIISFVFSILFGRLFYAFVNFESLSDILRHVIRFWTPGLNVYGLLIGALLPIYLLSKRWKWSIYRALDVFTLAFSLGFSIIVLAFVALQQRFEYLFVFAGFLIFYAVFSKYRNDKIKSGFTFAAMALLGGLTGLFLGDENINLIFFILLVTLSVLVSYFRFKKLDMTTNLSHNFIEKMKNKLEKKQKDLEVEEQLLIKDDPYLVEDREDDNADVVDDTYEDIEHTNVQARLSIVQESKKQVKKALDRIKKGTYGVSEVSGKPISKERLEAYPEATTRVDEESDTNQ